MTTPLKPCPFCGKTGRRFDTLGFFRVGCPDCDLLLTHISGDVVDERWNTRPGEQAVAEECLKILAALQHGDSDDPVGVAYERIRARFGG